MDDLKKMNKNVTFTGHLTGNDLKLLYEDSWLYLFPARITEVGNRDGIPNTIKEAMLMELQIIASPVSGIPELENISLLEDWSKLDRVIDKLPRKRNYKGKREIENTYHPRVTVNMLEKIMEDSL